MPLRWNWILRTNLRGSTLEEDEFPLQHFIDNSQALKKAQVDGAFLLEEEAFGLVRSLDSVRAILNFFKSDEESKVSRPEELCEPVKVFPFVT